MAKQIIVFCILASLACAQLSVTLSEQDIYTPSTSAQVNYQDTAIFFSPVFDASSTGSITILDTTATQDYQVNTQTAFAAGTGIGLSGNFIQVNGAGTQPSHSFEFQNTNVNNVQFLQGYYKAANAYQNLPLSYGLSLNIPAVSTTQNFLGNLKSSKVNIITKAFSFYISNSIHQLIIGQPQGFFSTTPLKSVNLWSPPASNGPSPAPTSSWVLTVTNLVYQGHTLSSSTATILAGIDTTTEFITVDAATYNAIVGAVGFQPARQSGDTTNFYVSCSYLTSTQSLGIQLKGSKATYNLQVQYLVRQVNNGPNKGQCVLLLQSTSVANQNNFLVWNFGHAYLRSVYTYFENDANRLQVGNAASVAIQPLLLNNNWRVPELIAGSLLILLALLIILTRLKPINYVPGPAPVKTAPVIVQQPVYYIQQQPLVYSQIPVQPNIAPTYVRTSSPQRVLPQTFQSSVVRTQAPPTYLQQQ